MPLDPTIALATVSGDDSTPALDPDAILTIHREPSGYIGFVQKPDPAKPQLDKDGNPKGLVQLFSIPAGELRTMFPAVRGWLVRDSYFTVNAYHSAAPWTNKTTGLPDVWRKEDRLSWLTACYADIDCGRPDSDDPLQRIDWTQALAQVEALMDTNELPQASMVARSGRGLYLFWLLHDAHDPDKLQRAWPEKILQYKKINMALHERLRTRQLPIDGIHDAARVLRTPGSIHRTANRRVHYWLRFDAHKLGWTYTLRELADWLKLTATENALPASTRAIALPAIYRISKNPGTAPLRSNGPKALNALRAQDLIIIEQWREGFLKKGMRYPDGRASCGRCLTLTLYARFLRSAGTPRSDALDALRKMAANCSPKYPSDDSDTPLETIVDSKCWGWTNAKLCASLGITDDVAADLGLATIRPKATAIAADKARPHQADVIADRQDIARQYLARYGRATARGLAAAYKALGVRGANHQTANLDLNAIGYKTERSRGGRPPKKAVKK
jgi:hypothetical protein